MYTAVHFSCKTFVFVKCLTPNIVLYYRCSLYSQKLQTAVKPGTVRKLKRKYGSRSTVHSDTTTTIDLLHSSIHVLNQVSTAANIPAIYLITLGNYKLLIVLQYCRVGLVTTLYSTLVYRRWGRSCKGRCVLYLRPYLAQGRS